MDEQGWDIANDPEGMLAVIYQMASTRRLRLYGVACVRRIWHLLQDERSRQVVEIAERYADRMASEAELTQANTLATEVAENFFTQNWDEYAINAADAAGCTVMDGSDGIFTYSYPLTVCATKCVDVHIGDADAERAAQADLLREIFANPFRQLSFDAVGLIPTVTSLATAAYEERALPSGELDRARLAVLSDALEDAGCDNADILDHLRSASPHVRGCWALDLILGRE